MMRLPLLTLALLAPAAHAGDATPYKIKLVVAFQRHRLLTDVFRDQVTREIRDGLQAALGKLARVSAAPDHPLLAGIRERGLDRGLGGHRGRDDFQTHFVLVGFSGSDYEIESGMHDGLTGLPGPVTRKDRTPDRAFVARLATLLVERDLALQGDVSGDPDGGGQVKVDLKGGTLGTDLARWVKKDDVFAAVRVAGDAAGRPVPFTLLQATADPADGAVTCRVWSRYQLAGLGPWAGMRAVRLATRPGPVRLRLMQDTPAGPKPLDVPMSVQIRALSFDGPAQAATSTRDREIDTGRLAKTSFERIAFVTVLAGTEVRVRVPVPVLDGRINIIPVPRGKEDGGGRQAFLDLRAEVLDALLVQAVMFEDVNKLTADPKLRGAAILRIKATLKRGQDDHERLTRKRDEGLAAFTAAKITPAEMKLLDDRLKQLRAGELELTTVVTKLEEIEKDAGSPERKEWLRKKSQAEALEKQAELGQALAIYKAAPEKYKDEVKARIADLEEHWRTKTPEHATVRKFIYETWPALPTNKMKDQLANARIAVETCETLSDAFGAIKFRNATLKHADRLLQEAKELKPGVNPGDDTAADLIKELSAELQPLVQRAEAVASKK